MAYYDALVTAWNSSIQPPTGATGTGLTASMATQTKLDLVNAWTVVSSISVPALLAPSQIINACVPADIGSLLSSQMAIFQLCLSGAVVDGSKGTTVRIGIQNIFAGKTTTLSQLGALVAPFDSPVIHWTQSVGYGTGQLTLSDVSVAGLS